MAPILITIGLIIGIAIYTLVDDLCSGRIYKADADKTEEDRRKEREQEDELHRIMWE
jgi:hypothetical protein